MAQKQTGPLQSLYEDIKKIIDFMEVKDESKASNYETQQTAANAELYQLAMLKRDTYITYKNWWTRKMFQEVSYSITSTQFNYYCANPYQVPSMYRDVLLEEGRQAFLDSYVEENTYYRMLMGLPAIDDNDYIYLSDELSEKYNVDKSTPVHELSSYVQNKYMTTDEYNTVLTENPTKSYLKYLGSYKIDLYTARMAKDFDIIRYPNGRTDINPYLLEKFQKQYSDSREYIVVTLYNSQMSDLYVGYRSFMGFLILAYTLMHVCNSAVESVSTHKYLDDTIIYIILSMYGVPDSIYLTNDVRRKLAIYITKLIKEKGTNEVYYDLINILGYQDVVVSKLMLMRGQQFDDGSAKDEYNPYFLQLDLKDENPYDTISSNNANTYSYEEITNKDPYWWDDEEVRSILTERPYSESDSKYIMIEGLIHQMRSMFESIYFSRLIIDNQICDEFKITIPSLFGTEEVSIYDCMVFLICATCMNNNLSGEIYTENEKLIATAGFNFDIDIDSFIEYIDESNYIDKEKLKLFLDKLTLTEESDINRLYYDVMYPLREWLESKIVSSVNRKEYLEYESVYRALFTYDITRNKILDNFEMPIETIRKKYSLSEEDMDALKAFYPHNERESVKVQDFNESINKTKYHYPFLSITDPIDWYLHIIIEENGYQVDRGYLYLFDILNSSDVRTLKNYDGEFIFMDEDPDEGWVVNDKVVEKVLYLIDHLEDDDLSHAYFQIYTVYNDNTYEANTKLPASVRTDVFKSILADKVQMDTDGLSVPPTSYFEYLYRKNKSLYNVLLDPEKDRFNRDKESWMNDVMTVITAIESELSIHIKYLEESVVGKDLYFKPLITLIKHFKSMLVEIANTKLKYIFDDKMDIGGNSNMLKFFDSCGLSIHFTTIKSSGYDATIGFYDTDHSTHQHVLCSDMLRELSMIVGNGFAAQEQKITTGSMKLSDEVKFYKNGKAIESSDTSLWYNGEVGNGRWSEEDDILMKTRKATARISNPVDLEYWKELVPSYNYNG